VITARRNWKTPLTFSLLTDTSAYRWLSALWRRRFEMLSANRFLQFAPPGHFYSPIPDLDYVRRHRLRLFNREVTEIPGIEIGREAQEALVKHFGQFYGEMPFKSEKSDGLRYAFDNSFFSYGDAIALYSVLRYFKPQRVIEVGSGHSSAVMLDTNDRFLSRSIEFTFIDPFPERMQSLLQDHDQSRHEVLAVEVQDIPLLRFQSLGPNDILFIDSSHVIKVGSDVVYLLSAVLPSLKAGVIVHFHDILWPFEYPESWLLDGRAWNEAYALKAFLQFNSTFEILFFNSYLGIHHKDVLETNLPLFARNPGGSIWLRKKAES
jgi:hypothetical protein